MDRILVITPTQYKTIEIYKAHGAEESVATLMASLFDPIVYDGPTLKELSAQAINDSDFTKMAFLLLFKKATDSAKLHLEISRSICAEEVIRRDNKTLVDRIDEVQNIVKASKRGIDAARAKYQKKLLDLYLE